MVESTRVRSKRLSFSGKKTLSSFMQVNIASLRQSGKLRTSETYRATLNSFMKFMDGKDVLLSNMDAELMMGYETYLKAQGASMNTVSFYMRILRATYNRAVDKGVIRQRFPFKHVYTGVEKTVKRAISSCATNSASPQWTVSALSAGVTGCAAWPTGPTHRRRSRTNDR